MACLEAGHSLTCGLLAMSSVIRRKKTKKKQSKADNSEGHGHREMGAMGDSTRENRKAERPRA